MGFFSNRISRESLKPGDHIYSWRAAYIYAHHGIYIGDNKVIHFTRGGQEVGTGTVLDVLLGSSIPSNPYVPCTDCTSQEGGHGVVLSCLNCFLAGGILYRFEYAVTPALFIAKVRGGTCTLAASDEDDIVVHRAKYLLNSGFGCYSIFNKNCEDFAIYCKTGFLVTNVVGQGQNVSYMGGIFSAAMSTPLGLVKTNVYVMAASAAISVGVYCGTRYAADMGIRMDVEKVSVVELTRRLRAEEIPEEEKNLGPHERLIHVCHFNKISARTKMHVQNFGEPFFLIIHEGDTLGEVKVRIQKKLQVPDEEFAKWKFAFLSLGCPEYLQDSDIVFAYFQRRDAYGAWEQYLGLEHSYTAPKQSYAANQMQGTPDTCAASLTASSMSGKSPSTLLENLKNLLVGFPSTEGTEKSTSSSNMFEGCPPPNPPAPSKSLQQHREVLNNYLASSLESVEQANAFDEIQRITLLLLQHSTSSLERTILKDLAFRLEAFKVIVPTTKSSTEDVRAQLTSLSGKKADVGARLGKAREHCDFLEAKFRKDSEAETEIEKQIVHLIKQKEGLRISKNSVALELEKFSEQVTKDVEEWKVISEESEEANKKWLQGRETLAQANLSWKLFKQNLDSSNNVKRVRNYSSVSASN